VKPQDVVWSYSGVRPLLDDESGDPSAVTRDYSLELDTSSAPLLTVWGGKITTFRKLAEEAADLLAPSLASAVADAPPRKTIGGAWTHGASLPGGDLTKWIGKAQRPDTDFMRFAQAAALRYPQLSAAVCHRLARAYGARIEVLLGDKQDGDLGAQVAPGLFEAELHYLHTHEWACSADDVLWRRSKLGLHYQPAQRAAVAAWCATHWPGPATQGESAGAAASADATHRPRESTWN
jgi:glycerol-3-phosphate dehydrogenase